MNAPKNLIFALTTHEVLGMLIEPFVVSVHEDGQFFYGLRKVNQTNVSEFIPELSRELKKVLEICDEYREENLVKQFSKKKLQPKNFYKDLSEERLKKIVRPWVEKRLANCLNTLGSNGSSIFYKGTRKDILMETKLPIQSCETEIILTFEKHEHETRYSLSLVCDNREVSLFHPGSVLITRNPCYALLEDTIYKLPGNFDGNKLLPFFRKEYIVVPEKNEKEFYRTFVAVAILDHKVKNIGFTIDRKKEICEPVLKFENTLNGTPALAMYFKYGEKTIPSVYPGLKIVHLKHEKNPYFTVFERDAGEETRITNFLTQAGLQLVSGNFYQMKSGNPNEQKYSLLEWVNQNRELLSESLIDLKDHAMYFTGKILLSVNIDETNDWFDVKAYAHFGDHSVPFTQLKKYLLNNIREYPLPSGKIAILPQEWFSRFHDTLNLGIKEGDSVRLKKHQFAVIEKLDEAGSQKFRKVFEKLKLKELKTKQDLPLHLNATLRPYQEKGFFWLYFLYKNKLGGLLADDMGLGKTIQVLTLLLKIKEEVISFAKNKPDNDFQLNLFGDKGENLPPTATSLIVMPLSLVHNWKSEIRKFAPSLRYYPQTGNNRIQNKNNFYKYDIILTTYGIIRNDLELLKEVRFNHIILDESQFIKNPDSKAFQAIKLLNSLHRIVLTGTPVENSLTDLWSQFSFLNPGLLGNLSHFKNEYVIPIEKQNLEDRKERLKELIEPFILRRTKNVVAKELPSLIEKIHYCVMLPEQQSLYETKKSEIRNRLLENKEKFSQPGIKIEILQSLMQLRLIANHPQLSAAGSDMDSGKFGEVNRNIENLMAEGHKVLIFSQFVKHLNLFRAYFEQSKWKYSWLTGELNHHSRKNVISEFQSNPENKLFLISLRAGGVGLNLTSADYVFILDPWWNPAVEKQAINRAHRIGQTKNVISYKFITKDSVEEKILLLQQKKEKLADDFVKSNNPFRVFSDKEIMELFK